MIGIGCLLMLAAAIVRPGAENNDRKEDWFHLTRRRAAAPKSKEPGVGAPGSFLGPY